MYFRKEIGYFEKLRIFKRIFENIWIYLFIFKEKCFIIFVNPKRILINPNFFKKNILAQLFWSHPIYFLFSSNVFLFKISNLF